MFENHLFENSLTSGEDRRAVSIIDKTKKKIARKVGLHYMRFAWNEGC